jgi:hypothetical protein
MIVKTVDEVGAARQVQVTLPVSGDNTLALTEERRGGMVGPCAKLLLQGAGGDYKLHVSLTPDQMRHLSALLARAALFIEQHSRGGARRPTPCLCDRPSHAAERDGMCSALTDKPENGMCRACWTPEKGQMDHR